VLSRLSKKIKPARQLFADLVLSQQGLGHRKEFHGAGSKDSRIMGEDNFLNDVLHRAEDLPQQRPDLALTLELVAKYFKRDVEELRLPGQNQQISRMRAFAAWAILECSDATLTELGHWLSRDVSSLSSAVRRLREKSKSDASLQRDMEAISEQLVKFTTLQA